MKKIPWMMTLSLCAACPSTTASTDSGGETTSSSGEESSTSTDTEDMSTTASTDSGGETTSSSGEESSTSTDPTEDPTDTTGESPACAGEDDDTRVIFVTSWVFNGGLWSNDTPEHIKALSGLARADAFCQHLAEVSHPPLGGCFKAWLSDEFIGPDDRLGLMGYGGNFMNTHNQVIDVGWEDLVANGLEIAVSYDEMGVSARGGVWTHTGVDGFPAGGQPCGNWTVEEDSGGVVVGNASFVGDAWTDLGPLGQCSEYRRLYCVQTN